MTARAWTPEERGEHLLAMLSALIAERDQLAATALEQRAMLQDAQEVMEAFLDPDDNIIEDTGEMRELYACVQRLRAGDVKAPSLQSAKPESPLGAGGWASTPWWRVQDGSDRPALRNKSGIVVKFSTPWRYEGQDERYRREMDEVEQTIRLVERAPEMAERIAELEAKVQALESAKPLAVLPPELTAEDLDSIACNLGLSANDDGGSWTEDADDIAQGGYSIALSRIQPVGPDLLAALAAKAFDAGIEVGARRDRLAAGKSTP